MAHCTCMYMYMYVHVGTAAVPTEPGAPLDLRSARQRKVVFQLG